MGTNGQSSSLITTVNCLFRWRILLVHRTFFVVAAIFLAVAIIAPLAILIEQADNDLDNYVIIQNPSGMNTNGNVSIVPTTEEMQESHTMTLFIVVGVEVVFVLLFAVTLYYGLKTHPT